MEVKITSSTENKLLNRKEIEFEAVQDGSTASRVELTKEICKKLSLHPDSTIIVRINQGFGSKESTGIAHSYASKEMLEKYEPKKLVARMVKRSGKAQEAEQGKGNGNEGGAAEAPKE